MFRGREGWYVLVRWLVVLALGKLAFSTTSGYERGAIYFVTFLFCLDALVVNIAVVLSTGRPTHLLRSLILAILSLATVASGYAVAYSHWSSAFLGTSDSSAADRPIDFAQSLYFSFVTITTVGYGDIHPGAQESLLQGVVVSEVLVGLFFVATILAVVVGWIGSGIRDIALAPADGGEAASPADTE